MDREVDELREPEADTSASPPKFMRSIQGWIIGLGGILAAILALKTTVVPLFSRHDPPSTERAQSAAKPVESDAPPSTTTTTNATAKKPLPTSYQIPGGSLSFDGTNWIEENNHSIKKFKQISRNSDGKTLIADETYYLRFPNEGGDVELTEKDKIDWGVTYTATPTDPQ